MADCSWNSDEENFDDLEDEEEGNNWAEIFSAPENELQSFRCHKDDNTLSEERLKMEENSTSGNFKQTKEDVEKNDPKSVDSSKKTLTRMELNDHKAGMVGLDKEKINQIIFEASKGSRYFENELKKEKQVAERIAKQTACFEKLTHQQRREALETTNSIVKELEQTRDLSRTFVHIDMDAFYAAVEILDNPELRDKPMAVGSNAMLSTSNYPARRYGVRAAMPGFIAKKLCPELIIVPTHFDKYKEYSRQVQEILAEYDPNFAMASLDEAYLDLTEHLKERQENKEKKRFFRSKNQDEPKLENEKDQDSEQTEQAEGDYVEFGNDAEEAVRELRFQIKQKTRLTASAGIAPNLMLAKVCSDRNKPNGQFFLEPDRDVVLKFVHSLPIRKISGIGRVSEQMLKALGIETCEDLYTKRDLLYLLHSPISFKFLIQVSLGLGNAFIAADSKRKSIGTETTFSEISKPDELLEMCDKLCQSLAEDMKGKKLQGKTVTIKLKTVKFEVKSRSLSPLIPVSTYEEIFLAAKELLKNEINACFPDPLRLRLMGVRLSNFQDTTSDSSKEAKQNTITGFLKQKQNFPCVEVPSSFVPTQQLSTEETPCLATPGQYFSKENVNLPEAFEEDSSAAQHFTSDCSAISKNTSPFSGPAVSSVSGAAKNCAGTLQDETAKPLPLFCPVCGKDQVLKPGGDAMIELNKHIDLCLNKATIKEIVSEENSDRSLAGENVVFRSDCRTTVEAGSSRGKRKRHSATETASKKVTLHSFWSK
ncbi:LOW QUALITY PROTEIN: DNA polymerase kappa-like [Oculina patagonica]